MNICIIIIGIIISPTLMSIYYFIISPTSWTRILIVMNPCFGLCCLYFGFIWVWSSVGLIPGASCLPWCCSKPVGQDCCRPYLMAAHSQLSASSEPQRCLSVSAPCLHSAPSEHSECSAITKRCCRGTSSGAPWVSAIESGYVEPGSPSGVRVEPRLPFESSPATLVVYF